MSQPLVRMVGMKTIAHIDGTGHTHLLHEHLHKSAQKAKTFADVFGAGEWAYQAALWHDLGKYSKAFQDKLLNNPEKRVDHSTAGAQYAVDSLSKSEGLILAWLIAGHHAGLADWSSADAGQASLEARLKKTIEPWSEYAESDILTPEINLQPPSRRPIDHALWVRMLFSTLVDADFLDTEAFFDHSRADLRGEYPTIPKLLELFEKYMRVLQEKAPDTPLNHLRSAILDRCIEAAKDPGGIYTLTVPTGGGKTLSSMAYALHHAAQHNKRRIIYVIPYTSIIEQNANVYRQIFGDAVIEHHSQFALDDEERPELARAKLAAENWDAPIIVTTTVQFFESLFAAKPSCCRKLHNIADSVVIIDEVQTLPIPYLQAIVDKINALQKDYDTTFLLCSATQPAFESFRLPESAFYGIESAKEIVPDPEALARKLRRTTITWELEAPKSYEMLAQEVMEKKQSALIVVNTRDRARKLFETLQDLGASCLHLSANMCGVHRSKVIEQIREKLRQNEPLIVVSTNLIEAGVDLDFPLLWREIAGLDSIAQAAGRCNREGRLPHLGTVTVFAFLDEPHPRYLRNAINVLIEIFPDIQADPLSPEAFKRYFSALFKKAGDRLDQKEVATYEINYPMRWRFATVAEKFRMIDDGYSQSVIIPYDDEADKFIAKLDIENINRSVLRKLQRYSINLPKQTVEKLLSSQDIQEVLPGVFVLSTKNLYNESIGFSESKMGILDVSNLVW